MYVAYSVYLNSVLIYRTTNLSCVLDSPVHFFHLTCIVQIEIQLLFSLLTGLFFYRSFPFTFSIFLICFPLPFFIFFNLSIRFPLYYVSLQSMFKSDLGDYLCKYAKDRDLKIDNHVMIYEGHDCTTKLVDSAGIFGVDMTDTDEFQRRLQGIDLSRKSYSDLVVINAVIAQNDSFTVPRLYKLCWKWIGNVP